MTWFKVDDRLHGHIKSRRAGTAMALWVLAGSYCADNETDGFVASFVPETLVPGGRDMADTLVEVGFWIACEGGWRFHDWAEYQPTTAAQDARRAEIAAKRAAAGRRSGEARRTKRTSVQQVFNKCSEQTANKPRTNREQTGVEVPETTPQRTNANPVPVPVEKKEDDVATSRATPPADDGGDQPKGLDLWALIARLHERSKGRITLTVLGTAERDFVGCLRQLARQGYRVAAFDDWADCAAAGEDDFWTGEYTTAALLGTPDADGSRPARGLAKCLDGGRQWAERKRAAAAKPPPVAPAPPRPVVDLKAQGEAARAALRMFALHRRTG